MKCRLIAKTEGYKGTEYEGQSIDNIISGIARISSSREVNELFKESDKLLNYCIKNAHWSIFDQADLTFQITTSMPIGEQCIRHQSFDFQKFSGRYAKFENTLEPLEFRKQGKTNRQVGEEAIIPTINGNNAFIELDKIFAQVHSAYEQLTEQQVALETARFILPLLTSTTFYMKGSIRSWITFLNVRLHSHAQKEIIQLSTEIKEIFMKECPIISKALYNFEDADKMYILDRIVLEKYGVFQMIKDNDYKKIKVEEPVIEEEVIPNPIWRVKCLKGFNYKGKDTVSIRTHEFKKAEEGYWIEILAIETGKTLLLSPEEVVNNVVTVSKFFGEPDNQYQLFNYYLD